VAANEPGQPALTTGGFSRDLPIPSIALAVGAHPDDVEFGCGATLAKWAAAGCTVHHLVCTDGSKGTWDVDADLTTLVATRQEEQRAAAAALGTDGEVVFLGAVDGELEPTRALRAEVVRCIRRLRPDVVLGHDPWKRYRLHPDHRNAGQLVCDAIVGARDPHFFRELGLPHHRPATLLLWEADEPDHVEDVTKFVDTKLHALLAHASQFESTMKATDETGIDAFRARIRARLASQGDAHDVGAAEIFKAIRDL
jgi:LmbE family N-acetylglucosaminyl deacetylase